VGGGQEGRWKVSCWDNESSTAAYSGQLGNAVGSRKGGSSGRRAWGRSQRELEAEAAVTEALFGNAAKQGSETTSRARAFDRPRFAVWSGPGFGFGRDMSEQAY